MPMNRAEKTAMGFVSVVTVAFFSTSEASREFEAGDMIDSKSQGKGRIAKEDRDREPKH